MMNAISSILYNGDVDIVWRSFVSNWSCKCNLIMLTFEKVQEEIDVNVFANEQLTFCLLVVWIRLEVVFYEIS